MTDGPGAGLVGLKRCFGVPMATPRKGLDWGFYGY